MPIKSNTCQETAKWIKKFTEPERRTAREQEIIRIDDASPSMDKLCRTLTTPLNPVFNFYL